MEKSILVTGRAGYIGSHTVVALSEQGYNPVIVDHLRNANEVVMAGLSAILGFEPLIHLADVYDYNATKVVFSTYSFLGVIHFAAYKAVGESIKKYLMYYQNNPAGLTNVLTLMEVFSVKNFVFSSSCTVYVESKESKEAR